MTSKARPESHTVRGSQRYIDAKSADLQIRDDNTLVVSITSTKDRIFSLTTRIEIPLSKIDVVSTEPVKIDEWRTVKVFAARWPSCFAGRFYVVGKGKKFFLLATGVDALL